MKELSHRLTSILVLEFSFPAMFPICKTIALWLDLLRTYLPISAGANYSSHSFLGVVLFIVLAFNNPISANAQW